jgi:tetratricopeptide (TPR) repeat protein
MILVFGAGFVVLGVGSGGLDLGSLLQDIGGRGGSSGPSISKLTKKVDEHPRDAAARKQLAQAYETKGQTNDAISEYQQYTALRPKDADALLHLARLQTTQADTYGQQAQIAYEQQALASAGSTFGVPSDSKFGKALGTDPINNVVQSRTSTAFQQANAQYSSAVQAAIATYKKVARINPTFENDQSLATVAERYQDYPTAIKAYKQALRHTDDPTLKAQMRAAVKRLQAASGKGAGG